MTRLIGDEIEFDDGHRIPLKQCSGAPTQRGRAFIYDGFYFFVPEDATESLTKVALKMAYLARRGNEDAAKWLKMFNFRLTGCDGRRYWPPE